jgi:hypothetical protein
MGQVQVHVDKPRQHMTAGQVKDLIGGWGLFAVTGADGRDLAVVDQQPRLPRRAGRTGPDRRPGEQPGCHRPHLPAPDKSWFITLPPDPGSDYAVI